MGFFDRIKSGLKKTRENISGSISSMLSGFSKIDEDLFEELEELLVMGDVGIYTAEKICDELRARVKKQGITDPQEVMGLIKEIVADMLSGDNELHLDNKPVAILVIGVNGVGKTTTIGKLASRFKSEGQSVVLGAADTFRAAAIDQLEVWAERAGVPIVTRPEGSDPASVVFDTIAKTKSLGADIMICDTAGRLHNKKNLMDELAKISRIINRELPDSDKEVLLVLDAATGQNAVQQARVFKEAAGITGIILTKLDGTAKGGVVLAIREELELPVKFIGVGEKIDDLQPFDAQEFAEALFDNEIEADVDEENEDTILQVGSQTARYDQYGELVIIDEDEREKEWQEWETGTAAGDASLEAQDIMQDISDALQEVTQEEPHKETRAERKAREKAEREAMRQQEAIEEEPDDVIVEEEIVEEPVYEEPEHKESWLERRAREKEERKQAELKAQQEREEQLAREQAEREAEERRQAELRAQQEREEQLAREQAEREEEERRQAELKAQQEREEQLAREQAEREAEERRIAEETAAEEPEYKESWFERRAREKAERKAQKEAERQQQELDAQLAREQAEREAEERRQAELKAQQEREEQLAREQAEREAEERRMAEEAAAQEPEYKESWFERRAREKAERKAQKEAESQQEEQNWADLMFSGSDDDDDLTEEEMNAANEYEEEYESRRETREERRARKEREKEEKRARKAEKKRF